MALTLLAAVALTPATPALAADLQPRTVAAFDRYVRLTEARMAADRAFTMLDAVDEGQRRPMLAALFRNETVIEPLTTRDRGRDIDVPGGQIHHWAGLAFVNGVTLDQALGVLTDYDAHARVYGPAVSRSALLSRNGDEFRVFLRFTQQRIITVVINSEHTARFTRPAADRIEGRVRSTRIAEVADPGTRAERELPVGHDGGYLWRINTYWRLLERDGGVYLQCESISLTRGIPAGFGWLIGPFVTSIPRESLAFTLNATKQQLGA